MEDTHAMTCLRCGGGMKLLKREYLQLGKTSWFWGELPNLLAGGQFVEFRCCDRCGKLEFFVARYDAISEDGEGPDRMAQTACPVCGREHDLDDPKCPFCGADNPNI